MAWTSGKGLSVDYTTFNFNAVGRIRSKTGAGVDAEYETENAHCSFLSTPISNGMFKVCEFRGNWISGFHSDQQSTATQGISFDACTFSASADAGSNAAWPKAKALTFSYCTFYGRVRFGYDAFTTVWPPTGPDHRTKFLKCKFFEEDANFSYTPPLPTGASCEYFENIFESDMVAARMVFDQCEFNVNCNGRVWIRGKSTSAQQCPTCPTYGGQIIANYVDMLSCTFKSRGRKNCPYFPQLEEPFTLGNVNLNGQYSTIAYPSSHRPPAGQACCYQFYPGTNYPNNSYWSVSTFNAAPFDPCKPQYTDPPILVPTVVCGQPGTVPIPYCADETSNMGGGSDGRAMYDVSVIDGNLRVQPAFGTTVVNVPREYTIIDIAGRVLRTGILQPGPVELPLQPLTTGVYMLVVDGRSPGYRFFAP